MLDFKELEERILKFWDDHDVFRKSMDMRREQGAKPFVFFEGPPTANAAPAIHHFIGRVFKDAIPRYQTMRGRYVLRKGGWDTHGLPVELQVEKALGFKNKKDIEKYGIARFNAKCRESVWQNKREWEQFTRRIGYWVDLAHPYITYETPYIESLWNVIGRFWDAKLLYQAHRVVPFCTRCGTPLSSHEVAQGYQTVTDTSAYVKFKVQSSKLKVGGKPLPKDTFILAWTTTPWTLPGNVALAVGADIPYVLAKKDEEHYVVAADLANAVLGAPLQIEAQFIGAQLVGTSYEPLFAVKALKKPKSYRVYAADFVSTTDGTGVVHTAVMYGEDDYQLGTALGLIKHHTVTEQGTFSGVSRELDGQYVKSAQTEQAILEHLEKHGLLLGSAPYEHEYPFCWRCGTPLLYYAKDSWFVRMSALNKQLLANNDTVTWVPAHLKDGRFGQWLREGKDWAFSRERYWGTPLPVWQARDKKGKGTGPYLVASSLDDLERYRARKANTYWLVRHGEATKNVAGIIDDGSGKSDLTQQGRAQVLAAAKALKRKLGRTKMDLVLYSPITRTRETAEVFARELDISRIVPEPRLEEIHLGPSLEGCHDSTYSQAYPTYQSRFVERPPGGESLTDLKARLWSLFRELEEKHEGRNIVLVSHEYPIWMAVDAAQGWDRGTSIAEKERRDDGNDFIGLAGVEKVVVRNLPRNDAGEVDMHRPYVDRIVLKRRNSKAPLYRVPELCDVWFDSGAMPYAQWHWPLENKAMFAEQFPADFIAEGIDQTRGWFYTLLAVSTALGLGAPYRTVLSYSHVLDEKGQKMSKSRGNIVNPDDVIGAVGVDAARWYFYTVNNPGDPKLFSMKEVRERLTGFMGTLQNCLRFYELYRQEGGKDHEHVFRESSNLLDAWVLSRLNGLTDLVTRRLDVYDLTAATRAIEQFVVDDFSQWWLRRSRKRDDALALLAHILRHVALLSAPFIPFTAEDLWSRLRVAGDPVSVHLADWPKVQGNLINAGLEEQMARVRGFITAGLAARKDAGIKVRQPLASVTVPLEGPLHGDLAALVRDELNVKEVRYAAGPGVTLDTKIGTELRAEGYAREVMRTVQDMRKELGLSVGEQAYCQWSSDDREITDALTSHADTIRRQTWLSMFGNQPDEKTLTLEKDIELAPGRKLWLGLRR